MTREEYIKNVLKSYSVVNVLTEKNDCKALRLRHKEINKDLVLHSFLQSIPIYKCLCDIKTENLPEVYDVVNLEDGQIVLEEFVDGMNVAQIMESGKYRYNGAKKVLTGVCNGLSVLHQMGFVHRDIKPENVVVDKNGRVVLIDFNASRKMSVKSRDTVVMGTVGYASPEQLGISQSDERTDIYALGVLLNVMVTGKHPSDEIAKWRVGKIVRKCTNVNPNNRYQTVEKFAKAL